MSECNLVSTSLKYNAKLCNDDDIKQVNGTLYPQLLGSLNHLTIIASPVHR